jgi:hypothetical protein
MIIGSTELKEGYPCTIYISLDAVQIKSCGGNLGKYYPMICMRWQSALVPSLDLPRYDLRRAWSGDLPIRACLGSACLVYYLGTHGVVEK